jgi:hypothetical protein
LAGHEQDGMMALGRNRRVGGLGANNVATIVVEFFGIPRMQAGRSELSVEATTAAEALIAVESRCPALAGLVQSDGSLVPHYLLSVDGRRFVHDLGETLGHRTRLLLLSADAGG